jgi:hypothetical protein
MSLYLYNLGFSLANAANGNFVPSQGGQTGLNQSDTWFQYNGSTLPSWVADNVAPVQVPLNASDWNTLTSLPSFAIGADYLVVRIFNTDGLPSPSASFLLRLTAVMGKGTSAAGQPAAAPLQSPFQVGSKARAVIDTDNSSNPPNWPTATASDGAWTYCFGMIHGIINDYSCNIGATAYVAPGGQYSGFSSFGHDPQLHVVMPNVPVVCDDEDAA